MITGGIIPGIDMRREKAFSTVELLVVVAIGLIITTIALPNMLNVIAVQKLRGNIGTLSGILQNCRMMAVKNNQPMTTHFVTADYGINAFIKSAADTSSVSKLDTQVELEAPILQFTSPTGTGAPTALDSSVLGFTPQTGDVTFNSRGLPCVYNAGVCTNNGFAYYFRDTRLRVTNGWAAISVSPAGRIKRWFWKGTAWGE